MGTDLHALRDSWIHGAWSIYLFGSRTGCRLVHSRYFTFWAYCGQTAFLARRPIWNLLDGFARANKVSERLRSRRKVISLPPHLSRPIQTIRQPYWRGRWCEVSQLLLKHKLQLNQAVNCKSAVHPWPSNEHLGVSQRLRVPDTWLANRPVNTNRKWHFLGMVLITVSWLL
jgi:hypothetical protein